MDTNRRKIHRDFKGKVNMMNITPLEIIEQMFCEYYNESLELYIKTEKQLHPKSSDRELLIKLYSISEKLKGRKNKK